MRVRGEKSENKWRRGGGRRPVRGEARWKGGGNRGTRRWLAAQWEDNPMPGLAAASAAPKQGNVSGSRAGEAGSASASGSTAEAAVLRPDKLAQKSPKRSSRGLSGAT